MSRSRILSLAPALAALTVALTASAALEIKGKPSVGFTAIGPGGLKINGTGDELKLKEDGDKLIFKASVKNLKTGIGLRDGHLKKAIDASKWPDASLVIDKKNIKFPDGGKVSNVEAKGKFRLHGVTKDNQKFIYSAEPKGDGYSVKASLKVNLDDYKIEQPCYLGVCVDKDIDITVSFQVKK